MSILKRTLRSIDLASAYGDLGIRRSYSSIMQQKTARPVPFVTHSLERTKVTLTTSAPATFEPASSS
jgi:hypothetical protein